MEIIGRVFLLLCATGMLTSCDGWSQKHDSVQESAIVDIKTQRSIIIEEEEAWLWASLPRREIELWEENVGTAGMLSTTKKDQKFMNSGLLTDTSKTSIDLNLVLGWWPSKDGIPAINNPKFYSISEAEEKLDFLNIESTGIAVEINGEAKFYPYNILVWHEIVNDSVWWKDISVTFCPLCGSAIVYDRNIDWETLRFGVSGKLYQSNLLMYDDSTESLWSQSIWKAVVWEKTWKELEYIQSNLLTFGDFKKNYTAWLILTDDTGAIRDYTQIPYWDYTENNDLYFPVENSDESFSPKEMFYIVNNKKDSLAFLLSDLRTQKQAVLTVWNDLYTASFKDGIIEVELAWELLPGYYEMWFSWATHNTWNKNIWKAE